MMDAMDSKTTSPALLGGSKILDIAPFRFLLSSVSFGMIYARVSSCKNGELILFTLKTVFRASAMYF